MKVLNERMIEIIKELVDLGVVDFDFWERRQTVELSFNDDEGQKVSVEVKI